MRSQTAGVVVSTTKEDVEGGADDVEGIRSIRMELTAEDSQRLRDDVGPTQTQRLILGPDRLGSAVRQPTCVLR